jgi:tRNA(Ile)-lysidine synthase
MLVPADRILAGVSGGADSVALALVLKELGYELSIAHVNHGLRGPASDADAAFVETLASELGLEFFAAKVQLSGGNVEAAGRAARKEFFEQLVRQHGFTRIALAHTRNDRVETFLFNLLRGAGAAGLGSMTAVTGKIVRPLIAAARADVEAYLHEKQQSWRTDASNFDLAFARNRLRHTIIPLLAAEFNPNLVETLSRTAEIIEGEDAWMSSLADAWLRNNGTKGEDGFVIPVSTLQAEATALVRRLIRGALREAGSDLRDVAFDHVESIRTLLEGGKSGKHVEVPGGIKVAREFDGLVFQPRAPKGVSYEYELQIPGSVHIPELGKRFIAEIVESKVRPAPAGGVFVDADSIGPYVRIRNWKPGDYYKPVGLPAGKLKKLFQRARIPRSHRTGWPVVVAGATIIWVASFPVSREFAPRGRSQKIVAIEAVQI